MLLIAVILLYPLKFIAQKFCLLIKTKQHLAYQFVLVGFFFFGLSYSTKIRNNVWSSEVSFWEDVIKKSPKKVRAFNNYAASLNDEGRTQEAMENYHKALKLDPDYVEPMINLAFHYHRQNKREVARKFYEQALSRTAGYPELFLNYAIFLTEENNDKDALPNIQYALKLNRYYSFAHYHLAELYRKQNKLDLACNHYQQATQGDDPKPFFFFYHGELAHQLGKHDEAIQSLEIAKNNARGLDRNTQHNTIFYLASSYYSQRQTEKACENFETIYKRNPNDKSSIYNYALTLLDLGKYHQAVKLFEKCKDDLANSALHYSKCLSETGNQQEAKNELNNLIQNTPHADVKQNAIKLLNEIS